MVGYLNNDEATKETIDEDGWLHTGDVAEMDDDGYYAIVDRLKELIKYKGFQVPPAELEAILINHPAVADCAVIGVPDDEAGELPKAFVVVSGDEVSDDELMDVRRREGLAAEEGADHRADRRDPEVGLRQDPASRAGGEVALTRWGKARDRRARATGATASCFPV